MRFAYIRESFRADIFRVLNQEDVGILASFQAIVVNPGLQSMMIYRIQQVLQHAHKMRLAGVLRSVNATITGADFVVGCEIGPGLAIPHPVGIVIGHGVTIGRDCSLMQGVTLGERYADGTGDHGYPRIGSRVVIGAGARILGAINIESGSVVGANSVVLTSVPENGVAVGIPAKVIIRDVQ